MPQPYKDMAPILDMFGALIRSPKVAQILKNWKGYTAREANKLLRRTGKPFWQTESFDHVIRDDEDMHRCCYYTTMNPVNARLCVRPGDWKWSSAYRPAM